MGNPQPIETGGIQSRIETFSRDASLQSFLSASPDFGKLAHTTDPTIIASVLALDTVGLRRKISLEQRLHMLIFHSFQSALLTTRRSSEKGGKKTPEDVAKDLGITLEQAGQATDAVLPIRDTKAWDEFGTLILRNKPQAEEIAAKRRQGAAEAEQHRATQQRPEDIQEQEEARKKLLREAMLLRMQQHGFKGTLTDLSPFQLAIADVVLPDANGNLTWDQIRQGLADFRNGRSDIAFYEAIKKATWTLEQYEGLRKGEITDRQHWQSEHHYRLIIDTKKQLIAAGKPNDAADISGVLGWPASRISDLVGRHHDTLDWSIPYAKMATMWETVARTLMEQRGIAQFRDLSIDEEFAAQLNAQVREEFGDRTPKTWTLEEVQTLWVKVREDTSLGRRRTVARVPDEVKAKVLRLYGDPTLSVEQISDMTGVPEGSIRAFASRAGVRRSQQPE